LLLALLHLLPKATFTLQNSFWNANFKSHFSSSRVGVHEANEKVQEANEGVQEAIITQKSIGWKGAKINGP